LDTASSKLVDKFKPIFFSPFHRLTNFMQQTPSSEADSHSASHEIICLL
jgi:hypothetical protein